MYVCMYVYIYIVQYIQSLYMDRCSNCVPICITIDSARRVYMMNLGLGGHGDFDFQNFTDFFDCLESFGSLTLPHTLIWP